MTHRLWFDVQQAAMLLLVAALGCDAALAKRRRR
jgi:hypothetical protein